MARLAGGDVREGRSRGGVRVAGAVKKEGEIIMGNVHTREVDHARKHGVGVGGREEAVGIPHPVHDDGVDEASDHGGVDEVRDKLTALRHGAGDDRGGGGGKGELEEPGDPVVPVLVASVAPVVEPGEGEVGRPAANEGCAAEQHMIGVGEGVRGGIGERLWCG